MLPSTSRFACALLLLLSAPSWGVHAAPLVPRSDSEVVERLGSGLANAVVRAARKRQRSEPAEATNAVAAAALARSLILQSRATADPRYLSYAQTTLAPWWNDSSAPVELLVLRATIRQSQHEFKEALADLDLVLERDPSNAQAWLTKATVLQVIGRFPEARAAALPLVRLADPLTAVTAAASVASVNGEAEKAAALLSQVLDRHSEAPAEVRSWSATILAETYARLGETNLAEKWFRYAFAPGLKDSYLEGAYADFLLDQGRPAEVIERLRHDIESDGLLLRLVLAEKALNSKELPGHQAMLKARFDAAALREINLHRREEGRFQLVILGDVSLALRLAEENWQVQKEPWDARLLLEAALAAKSPSTVDDLRAWLKESRLEDVWITRRLSEAGFSTDPISNKADPTKRP